MLKKLYPKAATILEKEAEGRALLAAIDCLESDAAEAKLVLEKTLQEIKMNNDLYNQIEIVISNL